MKYYSNLFLFSFAVILLAASCGDSPQNNTLNIENPNKVRAGAIVETGDGVEMNLSFNGKNIVIKATDIIGVAEKMSAESQDAIDIMNINQSLMGAEKVAQLLDVKFTMSDEPIDNGMFIFGMESNNAQKMTLEMYDEEGFALVANNKFEITEGNNYKALNVNSLQDGSYTFRIKDDSGKELNRTVKIETK